MVSRSILTTLSWPPSVALAVALAMCVAVAAMPGCSCGRTRLIVDIYSSRIDLDKLVVSVDNGPVPRLNVEVSPRSVRFFAFPTSLGLNLLEPVDGPVRVCITGRGMDRDLAYGCGVGEIEGAGEQRVDVLLTGIECGNEQADPDEECDGADLRERLDCGSFGNFTGTLACDASCDFDFAGCEGCGNGRIDGVEECDGGDLGAMNCAALGSLDPDLGFDGGDLGCLANCTFKTSECAICGNGLAESGEECDGNDFHNQTCASLGMGSGALGCDSGCDFDVSGCTLCGNGVIDGIEECDDADFNGMGCADLGLGFTTGTLECDGGCQIDTTLCTRCGDLVVDPGEECEGNSVVCAALGFGGGMMDVASCSADCRYDVGDCPDPPGCGNGTCDAGEDCGNCLSDCGSCCGDGVCNDTGYPVEDCASCSLDCFPCASCGDGIANLADGEACDGPDLRGHSCEGRGFAGGVLGCDSGCDFDDSGCMRCGDGVIDVVAGEECDGTDFGDPPETCVSHFGLDSGELRCIACSLPARSDVWPEPVDWTGGCHGCGDGVADEGESCDGLDLGGATCESEGLDLGTLACNLDCSYDTSGCGP